MARCGQCFADVRTGLECGDLQMKEQNGQYGPPRHGKREKLSMTRTICCEVPGCKNKTRFSMSGCFHQFCGHCLYEMEVIVNFMTHEQKMGFVCPRCVCIDRDFRWVLNQDVYSLLQEKSLCLCCFQVKTFDVIGCKHGICFACMKRLLDDKSLLEYNCVMYGCQAKYNQKEIAKMYENTISEMSWRLFDMPGAYNRKCYSCENLAVIAITKCCHLFCWDCIIKCPSDNSTNCMIMMCSIQDCKSSFPAECLQLYSSRILSTMQLATITTKLVRVTICSKCTKFVHQLLVRCHPCNHRICLPCFEEWMLENSEKREELYLGFPMEMTKCLITSCDTEIPTACLKAIQKALNGDEIAITMYFQHPRRDGKGQCYSCNTEIAYMEIVPCKHQLCKRCMERMYSVVNEWGVAECRSCTMPLFAQWLKTVLEKPVELLLNNRNYFEELTKKDNNMDDTKSLDIGADTDGSTAFSVTDANSTEKINSKGRNTDLLCPSYEWNRCSYCLRMAVIIFTACSHGWCLKCLKFLVNSQKEDKLQCNFCTSCGSIGNAKRCIRKYEAEGLLVPSYLKPVGGSTCCNICRKNQAMLEEVDCGHRICESCLCMCLQFKLVKCPVLTCDSTDVGNQEPSKNTNRRCDSCSRKKAEFFMKKCGHASCRDCIFRIIPCPIKGCKNYMDEATFEVMSKHIKKEKAVMFLSDQIRTNDGVSVCSGDHGVNHDQSEPKVQVRRCKHIICNQCFVNLQEIRNDMGISTCPSKDCTELFFLPLSHSTRDHASEVELKKEDHHIKSKGTKTSTRSAKTHMENATDSTLLRKGKEEPGIDSFSFRQFRYEKSGIRERGLPNLGFTCYRNSVFQVLAESPGFLQKLKETTENSKEDWTFTLCEIMWRIYSKSTSRAAIEYWLHRMHSEFTSVDNSFVEYRQNDSLSFLTSILSGIADEMQNKRQQKKEFKMLNDPSDIFKGQIYDKYTCCSCKKTENHGESDFFSLPLPVVESGTPKIGECLFQFFTTETLRDVFPCTYCKHDTVLKEIQIKKYPEVLVLQLGMISERTDHFERVQQSPRFWENFKGLSNSMHLSKIDKNEFSKYTLYGVIVHTGGLAGGHYYAYVKRLENEKWERCDDNYVKGVDLKEVLRSNAYILFYHKYGKASC